MAPGSEEYLDSEKYQYRQRNWEAPGNINSLIGRLNTIRRAEPALQSDTTVSFVPVDNAHLLAYTKAIEGHGVLVVVNLDPHAPQYGWVSMRHAELDLGGDGSREVEDLLDGNRYVWQGEKAYVRLDPAERVAHILKPTAPPHSGPA